MALHFTSRGKSVVAASIVAASVATAAVVAAPAFGPAAPSSTSTSHHEAVTPDWTIAPCSFDFRPGMTKTIELPAYTYTDRCVQPDGTVTVADTFKVVEVFPSH
jgi:hypothetical protein